MFESRSVRAVVDVEALYRISCCSAGYDDSVLVRLAPRDVAKFLGSDLRKYENIHRVIFGECCSHEHTA